jgi:ATP-dependent 26S proteasome regulatory subunit
LPERAKGPADIDPMHIDPSIGFGHVGGLSHHIRSLKEMIVFPLLYPEFFERFKMDPPRGVLFYGPPGRLIFLVELKITQFEAV